MEREHSHGGESLVSCLAALYLQYGPALSQMLRGERTFTTDVFQHCNIVMPSDSVGPGPQERQMGRQGCYRWSRCGARAQPGRWDQAGWLWEHKEPAQSKA